MFRLAHWTMCAGQKLVDRRSTVAVPSWVVPVATWTGIQCRDDSFHFSGLRKALHLVLGENQLAIDVHVEDAALAADQLGVNAELLLQ